MSADDASEIQLPRDTMALFGHAAAEQTLLDAYRGPRPPHAWLIGGPPGIGKATLAYRMARFVLAHPDPRGADVQRASTLAIANDGPTARKIAAQAHSDLLVLERTLGDTGKLRQDIRVEDVRRSVGFFGSTAGEGGWRVAIVDAVDDLNTAGANALLKVLEEPPPRAMFLLVSHAPGRVLATIRSRSRTLALRPLEAVDVAQAAAAVTGRDVSDAALVVAAESAEGSVPRALALLDGAALAVRQRVTGLLDALPQVDAQALHRLGDELGGTDWSAFTAFVDAVNAWLSGRLTAGAQDTARLAKVAETFATVNREARTVEAFNLDRKPFVFATFGLLAESVRR